MRYRSLGAITLLFTIAFSVYTHFPVEYPHTEAAGPSAQTANAEAPPAIDHQTALAPVEAARDNSFGATVQEIRLAHNLKRPDVIALLSKALPEDHPLQHKISETWLQTIE